MAVVGLFLPLAPLSGLAPGQILALGLLLGGLLLGGLIAGGLNLLRFNRPPEAGPTESLYVGNLVFRMPPQALRELFEQYGQVHAVRIMTDRITRKPRGFGFVVMNRRDARAAIRTLDGKEFFGRELKVNIAHERKPRPEPSRAA